MQVIKKKKPDDHEAEVWFVGHKYNYRQNWTTQSPGNYQKYDKSWERN